MPTINLLSDIIDKWVYTNFSANSSTNYFAKSSCEYTRGELKDDSCSCLVALYLHIGLRHSFTIDSSFGEIDAAMRADFQVWDSKMFKMSNRGYSEQLRDYCSSQPNKDVKVFKLIPYWLLTWWFFFTDLPYKWLCASPIKNSQNWSFP